MPSPEWCRSRRGGGTEWHLRVVRAPARDCQIGPLLAALFAALAVFLLGARTTWAAPASIAGAPFGPVVERPKFALRSCDRFAPVCVHAPLGASPDHMLRLRHAMSDAWSLAIDGLRIPPPISDGGAGGDPRLDVYLVAAAAAPEGLVVGRGPLDRLLDRDASPGFLLVSEEVVRNGGCSLSALAARAIVRASALGLDVAETEVVVDGLARRIAQIVAPCPSEERARFAAIQQKPFRAMTWSPAGPESFARFLDLERGYGYGAVVPALLSMAIGHHGVVVPSEDDELGPVHFKNVPSVFDVLAATLGDAGSSLHEAWLEWAVFRALADPPPDWDWSITVSSLPRKLAVRRGIEPTGTTFVRIDVDAKPKGDAIEIDLAWDQGAKFVWRVIQLDAQGKRLKDVPVPVLETARKLTVEMRHLDGVRTCILVGVNAGDPKRPFHPDEPLSPARGYEVGVYTGQ